MEGKKLSLSVFVLSYGERNDYAVRDQNVSVDKEGLGL